MTHTPPVTPPLRPLIGRHVRLEPLREHHLDDLMAAIGTRETFAFGWGGGEAAWSPDPSKLRPAFARLLDNHLPHLVTSPDGRVLGTSSISEFEPDLERCHLGWTAYTAQAQGTAVNPECKLLLLGHVFDHGWGRVKIQTDATNQRSRAAIAKLGATFEGITRRDRRRADGSWRDAAVFSIIVDDWPQIRSGLEARVAAFDVGAAR